MKEYPIYQIDTFNSNTNQNDIYISTVEEHLEKNPFIENSHSHHFYLVVFFTKGLGTHTIDFDTFIVEPGCLYVIQPGQIHSWKLSNTIGSYIVFYSKEIYNLYFGNKRIEEYPFYKSSKNTPQIKLKEKERSEIAKYFDLLITENKKQESRKTEKLLNIIDIIHIEITRNYTIENNHNSHSYNQKINSFEALVNQYYKSEKSPSFYSNKMNITLKHLNRICKEVLNITATELIAKRVILESKRILSTRKKSIGEIADLLGYENYPYFTKLFKKHTSITPTEFKKSLHLDE